MRRLVRMCAVFVCATVPLSCGGSGGGDEAFVFTPAQFAGDYHAVRLAVLPGPPISALTNWGTLTPDGVALLAAATLTGNRDGAVAAFPIPALDFALTSAGELTLSLGGTEILGGGLAREGRAATLASSNPSTGRAEMLFLLEQGSGFTAAALSGPYHVATLLLDPVQDFHQSIVGTATFDGVQNGVLGATKVNTGGNISIGASPAFTYTVAPDGRLDVSGSLPFSGGILPGGALALVGGGPTNGSSPVAAVYIRESGGASAATFSGTYSVAGFGRNVTSGAYEAFVGTFTADGSGLFDSAVSCQGVGAPPQTVTRTGAVYSVAANGRFVVDVDPTGTGIGILEGAVTAGGEFAFLGGGVSTGGSLRLLFLVRR